MKYSVRVVLPAHLRTLAKISGEVEIQLAGEPTTRSLIDALEESFPALRGTVRDYQTQTRRPYVRFFACEQDLSHAPLDTVLPEAILDRTQPFLVIGAMAGG